MRSAQRVAGLLRHDKDLACGYQRAFGRSAGEDDELLLVDAAKAMAAECLDHRIALPLRMFLDRCANIAQPRTRLHRRGRAHARARNRREHSDFQRS